MSDPTRHPGVPAGPATERLDASPSPAAAGPLPSAPLRADGRATQVSATRGRATLESPRADAADPEPPTLPGVAATDEIHGEAVVAGPETRRLVHGEPPLEARRGGPTTLASPIRLAGDDGGAPLPPLPAVVDVGAPAHAFVAKSSRAPPPMPPLTPAPPLGGGRAYPYHADAQPDGAARAPRRGVSTSTMALVVAGAAVALLGTAALVATLGLVALRRTHAAAPASPPARPPAPSQPQGERAPTATPAPRAAAPTPSSAAAPSRPAGGEPQVRPPRK